MKKFKFLSFILTLALVFNLAAPAVHATEINSSTTTNNGVTTNGDYSIKVLRYDKNGFVLEQKKAHHEVKIKTENVCF